MKITKEHVQELLEAGDVLNENDEIVYQLIEEGEWTQDHKYQFCDIIFEEVSTGKTYQFTISRSGSPFTDWYYDWDYTKEYDCVEVVKKEVKITSWEKV